MNRVVSLTLFFCWLAASYSNFHNELEMIKEAAQERLHNIQHLTISLTSLDQQHFPDNGTRDSYHFGGLR